MKINNKIDQIKRYEDAFKMIADLVNKQAPKKKHYFIRAFRKAKLKRRELIKLGYTISFDLWRSCITEAGERNPGGRPALDQIFVKEVNNFLEQESRPSAYRTVQVKKKINKEIIKEPKVVRLVNDSFTDIHYRYNKKRKSHNISFSTFNKYKEKIYKNAKSIFSLSLFLQKINII
jgi:hypothetical protein